MTFDRFIINDSNQLAAEAARAVAEHPATVYNPFLVYGGVGIGKTHLLQAIANSCGARGLQVLYVSSESFTNDLVHAIRNRTSAIFREKYRSVDVLLVDDIQFIRGKDSTQEEFFHTFNTLVNFNKQIVLASDRHPRELTTLEDRLRSRFQGGLVADIGPPELETRIANHGALGARTQSPRANEHAPHDRRTLIELHPRIARPLQSDRGAPAHERRRRPEHEPRRSYALNRYEKPADQITVSHVIDVIAGAFQLDSAALKGKKRLSRINRGAPGGDVPNARNDRPVPAPNRRCLRPQPYHRPARLQQNRSRTPSRYAARLAPAAAPQPNRPRLVQVPPTSEAVGAPYRVAPV